MENKVILPYNPTKVMGEQEEEEKRAELASRFARTKAERDEIRREAKIRTIEQMIAQTGATDDDYPEEDE